MLDEEEKNAALSDKKIVCGFTSVSEAENQKYTINSLIYVSTTDIYWSIDATCFDDLLTGRNM